MRKLRTCQTCKSSALREERAEYQTQVGPLTFSAGIGAQRCESCQEMYYSGPDLARFEAEIARTLVAEGASSKEAFRYLRKTAKLRALELAELLGVTPDTVSRWENGHSPCDRSVLATLGSLALEALEGHTTLKDRLEALAEPLQEGTITLTLAPA